MTDRIKVMLVDDSALVRTVLGRILSHQPDMQLIATASDPIFAMQKMQHNWPDVLVLDIDMPRMDGLTFLGHLMKERPTPVVICSALSGGSDLAMQALAGGAVAVIAKPALDVESFLNGASAEIVEAVRAAALANLRNIRKVPTKAAPADKEPAGSAQAAFAGAKNCERIVAIGASTGGTLALEQVLTALPADSPAIVIVQHMPAGFTQMFAERLDSLCAMRVLEASDGQPLEPGLALIAPGGLQTSLIRKGGRYQAEVRKGPPVNRHCPSVDVLFHSLADIACANTMGIIMTGMGDDGARGLRAMQEAGAYTLAQDEASCVVYGMPREAVELGAVDRILPLSEIAASITLGPPVRP